jgi:predicted CXXCH cytochrome family protein
VEALVSFLTRRKSGDVVSRDVDVSCEVLRFGRGTDNEVQLSDPRTHFHEAELHDRSGGLFFEASGKSIVLIDGAPAPASQVQIGMRIQLGPYEIVFVDPPEGKVVALTIELIRPLGDSLELLKERSRRSIADTFVGKRPMSWALVLFVFAAFLVWPVLSFFSQPDTLSQAAKIGVLDAIGDKASWNRIADLSWESGEISGSHKFLADNCKACHREAFVQVTDQACATCHAKIQHHIDPVLKVDSELSGMRCQNCHKEHSGPEIVIRQQDVFCLDCHDDLKSVAANTKLLNSESFGDGHPEFRPSVVVDASTGKRERLALDKAATKTAEKSNLKFPHKTHLKAKGVRSPVDGKMKVMVCNDCHRPESGGVGMAPIRMDSHCADCHQLKFEPKDTTRLLPHGDVRGVVRTIREFYSDMVLKGGVTSDGDAAPVRRRRPGQTFTKDERLQAIAWVEKRARKAEGYVFGKSVCGACHVVTKGGGQETSGWKITPVELADRWMPKGRFHHERHEMLECKSCHEAAKSEFATDVILPSVASCGQCHGGENATRKVPSACVMCHDFHIEGLPPMHPLTPGKSATGSGTPTGTLARAEDNRTSVSK